MGSGQGCGFPAAVWTAEGMGLAGESVVSEQSDHRRPDSVVWGMTPQQRDVFGASPGGVAFQTRGLTDSFEALAPVKPTF